MIFCTASSYEKAELNLKLIHSKWNLRKPADSKKNKITNQAKQRKISKKRLESSGPTDALLTVSQENCRENSDQEWG